MRTFSASEVQSNELVKFDRNLNSLRPESILLAIEMIIEM